MWCKFENVESFFLIPNLKPSRADDYFSHLPWREVIGLQICRSVVQCYVVVFKLNNNYARMVSNTYIVHSMAQIKSKRLLDVRRSSNPDMCVRQIYR